MLFYPYGAYILILIEIILFVLMIETVHQKEKKRRMDCIERGAHTKYVYFLKEKIGLKREKKYYAWSVGLALLITALVVVLPDAPIADGEVILRAQLQALLISCTIVLLFVFSGFVWMGATENESNGIIRISDFAEEDVITFLLATAGYKHIPSAIVLRMEIIEPDGIVPFLEQKKKIKRMIEIFAELEAECSGRKTKEISFKKYEEKRDEFQMELESLEYVWEELRKSIK